MNEVMSEKAGILEGKVYALDMPAKHSIRFIAELDVSLLNRLRDNLVDFADRLC